MSSDGKDYGTGFPPAMPSPCENGCGFFGTAATNGLCSKCYRDLRMKEEQEAVAKSAMDKLAMYTPADPRVGIDSSASIPSRSAVSAADGGVEAAAAPNRCWSCKKKVGVLGFTCRCGCTFCGVHRYAEKHGCTFDFKSQGRDAIAKENPVIKVDKIQRF